MVRSFAVGEVVREMLWRREGGIRILADCRSVSEARMPLDYEYCESKLAELSAFFTMPHIYHPTLLDLELHDPELWMLAM